MSRQLLELTGATVHSLKLWVRVALGQGCFERSVVAVDVPAKVNLSVLLDDRGSVNDQDRHRLGETNRVVVWSPVHSVFNPFQGPFRFVAQQPLRHFSRTCVDLLTIRGSLALFPAEERWMEIRGVCRAVCAKFGKRNRRATGVGRW